MFEQRGHARESMIGDRVHIRQCGPADTGLIAGLCDLLIDAVQGGASIGFLAPLSRERAARYWDGVVAAVGPALVLLIAEEGGTIVGSVQLALCEKDNGLHRADIQKLFVLQACRGRGIARRLLSTAEGIARRLERTLLVLDTEAGSAAEYVYRHLGWIKVGEIPDYAGKPDGRLIPTAYYYKKLERNREAGP